jgi:hypothetical protein
MAAQMIFSSPQQYHTDGDRENVVYMLSHYANEYAGGSRIMRTVMFHGSETSGTVLFQQPAYDPDQTPQAIALSYDEMRDLIGAWEEWSGERGVIQIEFATIHELADLALELLTSHQQLLSDLADDSDHDRDVVRKAQRIGAKMHAALVQRGIIAADAEVQG